MSNYPKRSSHDAIRQAERVRFQELTAIGAEFGCAGMVPAWVADGVDPANARDQRVALAADAERRRVESEVRPHPDGPVFGAAAVALLTSAFFGRPDVAAGVEVPAGQRVAFTGAGRDALARVAGITGRGAGPDLAWAGVLAEAGGAGIDTTLIGGERVTFGAAAGAAGAAGRGASLPATVEDSLREILRHDWERSGAFWMACTRMIRTTDFRSRIYRMAMSGAASSDVVAEGLSPVRAADSAAGWLDATMAVVRRRNDLSLSYERWISVGGAELSAWLQTRLALWNDEIDAAVAEVIGGLAVRTVAGTFDDGHWDKAITAVNRQTVGEAVLGASLPIAVVGENRRAGALSLTPRAEGDRGAALARVECSAVVDPDFAAVVHPRFMPCAISHLRESLMPIAAMGPAVKGDGGARSDLGACVMQDRSAPALILDADDQAVGVVRLTV